jgi:hypothetical protein
MLKIWPALLYVGGSLQAELTYVVFSQTHALRASPTSVLRTVASGRCRGGLPGPSPSTGQMFLDGGLVIYRGIVHSSCLKGWKGSVKNWWHLKKVISVRELCSCNFGPSHYQFLDPPLTSALQQKLLLIYVLEDEKGRAVFNKCNWTACPCLLCVNWWWYCLLVWQDLNPCSHSYVLYA